MKSIFDRGFKYVPSLETDVGRTFARIRRQQLKKKGLTLRSLSDGAENVVRVTVQDMRIKPGRNPYGASTQGPQSFTPAAHSRTARSVEK